jgi:PDZ domain-containing secreted protein
LKALGVSVCLLFVASSLISAGPVFSQDEADAFTKEALGNIGAVNADNSSLVVKQLKDKADKSYEDLIIYADDSTFIEKNEEVSSLSDLETGEEISVEYYTNETGENIAGHIWVND